LSAQAVFESNVSGGSGNWNSSGSWTLISGSDGDNLPDANDHVTILSGDQINIRNNEACDDLTIAGTLNYSRSRRLTVNGDLVMSGTSAEVTGNNASRELIVSGNFDVPSGANVDINGQRFEVSGTTTIDGTLNILSSTGDKAFNDIDINASGTWNNNSTEDFTINGNLTNDGSFTGCTDVTGCDYTFTNSSGIISGSGTITLTDLIVDTGASYTSTADIIITDELTGNGAFTNGAGATLELQNAGPFDVATFTASASPNTVTYTGTGTEPVFETTFHNLVINKSTGTIDNNGTITVNNDFTVSGGSFEVNASMSVGGDVTVNGGKLGVYDPFEISGSIIIEGGEFTPDNGNADVTVAGDIIMSSGDFDHNNGDVTITSGDLIISGGTFVLSGGSVTVGDTYDVDGGLHDFNGGAFNTVDIDIAASQEILLGIVTFNHTGTSNISGTITVDSGSGTLTFNDITIASGGNWNVIAGADFTITGDITHNGASWTACNFSSCNYALTSTSGTISGTSAVSFTDVIINGTGSYTNNGTLTVSDRLTGTGAFTNGTNASFTYTGNNSSGTNFDITGFTASAAGNTVTYARAGNMQLRTTSEADNNYYNVVINTGASDVTLAGNITVDNQLTMTGGDVILGSNRLTIEDGALISGGSASSYIQINSTGVLRQNYSATGASLSFPIGDNNEYSPITSFTLTAGSFSPGAYVEFDITDANHPNRDTDNTGSGGDDDGTPSTAYISRYWTLTGSGISGEQFDATYQYLDADITGTEANMVATLYRGLVSPAINDWREAGMVTAGTNTVTLTGGDNFGDLYAMDNDSGRLPIVLISFEAQLRGDDVELKWVTATEESNAIFTIERSANGVDFEPVLFLDGAGDSDQILQYIGVDNAPLSGRSYYRLKQTDFNGLFTYSEVVSVMVQDVVTESLFGLYNNPASQGETLTIARAKAGIARLEIRDINGRSVLVRDITDTDAANIPFAIDHKLSVGVYLILVTQNGVTDSKRFIIR
jgi:hypothetical protein